MFLTPSDFVGKYELHTGMYDQVKLQEYIYKYEKRYLIELFGATLYDEFISDLDTSVIPHEPKSPNFIKVFEPFHENVNLYQLLISEGIIEMLKGFIYFEYSKDLMNTMTPFGNVKQKSENSTLVTTLNSMIFTRYNEAVRTYKSIRDFMLLNSTLPVGQAVQFGINSQGTLYSTQLDVQLNQIGSVETATLTSIGTGYSTASAVNVIGGNGVGMLVDIVDDGAGGIQSFTIVDGGSGYAQDDIVTIDAGNQDATLLIDQVINTIVGSGCTLYVVANNIGGCDTLTITNGGSGYVDASEVATTGGTGTGLFVDIVQDGITGLIIDVTIASSGQNYTIGDVITITGGNNDAQFTIDTITNGEVTEVSPFNDGGSNYSLFDTFVVDGGNNDCVVEILYIGKGSFKNYNGIDKIFAYWL
jgi:hypothetical protein